MPNTEMTFNEKKELAQGISRILGQPNFDKIMLNLEELRDLSICQGHREEADVLAGLCERPDWVEKLRYRIRKGYGIGFIRIENASKGKDYPGEQ